MAGSSSVLMPVPQSSAFDSHSWRRAGSPRFLGNPSREHALLFDPGGPDASGHKTHPMLPSAQLTASAPRSVTFRGSITRPARSLSTLHGSDYSDSNTAQDSLPTGGQPCWGRTLTCWVASEGFHSVSSTHIVSPSSKLFLAHQLALPHSTWLTPVLRGRRARSPATRPRCALRRRCARTRG